MDRAQFFKSDRPWLFSFCEFRRYRFMTISNEPPWKCDQDSVSIFLCKEILQKIFKFEICENVRTARSNFEKITFFHFSYSSPKFPQKLDTESWSHFQGASDALFSYRGSVRRYGITFQSTYEKLCTVHILYLSFCVKKYCERYWSFKILKHAYTTSSMHG